MLNKIFSWFEHRLNPYPDQSPKTPDTGLLRFIWSSIDGMKGWILLLAVLTTGNLMAGKRPFTHGDGRLVGL